ncbi:lipopolysaccharide modification acyltransferase [Segatella salivae]|uniref:lipopolysaccharide modification acyltransferase n=1 Tax=Segatella salivae TaxID=228604 RepID=UPI00352C4865
MAKCGNIPMNKSAIENVATTQRRRCCTFYSPGLASEGEVYPGPIAVRSNNAVGVVPFIPRLFIAAFHAENVQHLRR